MRCCDSFKAFGSYGSRAYGALLLLRFVPTFVSCVLLLGICIYVVHFCLYLVRTSLVSQPLRSRTKHPWQGRI